MYRLKEPDLPESTLQTSARATEPDLPESTLQTSARATESIFQAANRTTYLEVSQKVMTIYPGEESEQNLRESVFTDQFKKDLKYWQKTDSKKLKRIRKLIEDIQRDPFEGIGKPEPLKYMGSDVWSRRINDLHRIIYLVSAEQIDFLQARFHYTNK